MTPHPALAPTGRFDDDGDWLARQFVSAAELALTPDEYVARHADRVGTFSLHLYLYRDPALAAWVRRVGELLASEAEVERCREHHLSPAERAEARRRQAEAL